jgi:hypothetical protein
VNMLCQRKHWSKRCYFGHGQICKWKKL